LTFVVVFGADVIYTPKRSEEGVFISQGRLALGSAGVDLDKLYMAVDWVDGVRYRTVRYAATASIAMNITNVTIISNLVSQLS
jgi:hypothetical protein